MFKTNLSKSFIFTIASTILLVFIFSILNKNYLVSALYILSMLLCSYILKKKDTYNSVYSLLLVSMFFDYSLYVPYVPKIYLFHIFLFIFTLLSLYKLLKNKEIFSSLNKKVIVFLIIFALYICLSIVWSLNKTLSIKYLAIYVMMFSFIADMMIYNLNKERLKQTLLLLLSLISIVAFIGLIEVILGQQLPIRHYYDGFTLSPSQYSLVRARAIVFSFNTNNLAAMLAILSPLTFFAMCKCEKLYYKIFLFIVSTIIFALITITTSRTGTFSIELSLAAYFIYSLFNIRKKNLKKVILPLLFILSFTLCKYNALKFMNIKPIDNSTKIDTTHLLSDKMNALSNGKIETGGEGSINVRWTIIDDVLHGIILEDKKLLGFGVGNTEAFLREKDNTNDVFSPHCYAIEILGDFGVPGVILYGIAYMYLLLSNLFIGIKKQNIYCIGASSGMLTFSIASFGPSSITYVFSYWILLSMAISCIQVFADKN